MQADKPPPTSTQPELQLDHSTALEQEMRTLFEFRWARWHRAKTYEEAVADPVTRQLLCLAVQHAPSPATPRRVRTKPPRSKYPTPA
jgi:hypothetical protein